MPAVLVLLLDVVLPVFLVIAAGAAIGVRFGLEVAPINRVALYAAVPALAYRTLAELELGGATVTRLLAGYAGYLLVAAALAALIGRGWTPIQRRALVGTSVLPNAANLNLPVALFAFGAAGLERALVLYVATSLLMFTLGPSLVGRPTTLGRALRTVLGFPVLWAALLGLVVNGAGLSPPTALARAVGLLADAAIPLVLLTLGVQLVRARRWRPSGAAWTAVGLKLGVGPLLAAAVGLVAGLRGLDLAVLVLIGAMPTAVNAAMLAVEFDGDAALVGDAVVAGTALALVTLPIVLTLALRLV
ncbi:MAG: AEC family transporter [Trueperaceae bacterium]